MFIVNLNFGLFKLLEEVMTVKCPVCEDSSFDFRNIGFVNAEWILKGKLKRHSDSRIFSDGKTYDGKLYTFKELNFKDTYE